jgi:hypothetical protein
LAAPEREIAALPREAAFGHGGSIAVDPGAGDGARAAAPSSARVTIA